MNPWAHRPLHRAPHLPLRPLLPLLLQAPLRNLLPLPLALLVQPLLVVAGRLL